MRALTSASMSTAYTAAQLEAALRRGVYAFGPRFALLDTNLSPLGQLSTVTKAKVEMNVDRAVKGSLDLEMLPDPLLPFSTAPFTRYIQASFRITMDDGGYAEWPQGLYLWTKPKRNVESVGFERWTVSLGDRGVAALAGGPGASGYTVAAGVKTTDAIVQTLQAIFGSGINISRISPSGSTVASALTWDMTQDVAATNTSVPSGGAETEAGGASGTNGTTWADILQALTASIGYYSMWFDATGLPVAIPVPALTTAAPGVVYSSGSGSLLQAPLTVDDQLDKVANRVVVRSKNASPSGPYAVATADLNTLIPGHPYSQAVIGFYIDAVVDDTVASTQQDLQARANAELYTRAAMYQKVTAKTLTWPVHEAFDLVGLQWAGDVDFGVQQTLHERTWSLDLFTGETTREMRRITAS